MTRMTSFANGWGAPLLLAVVASCMACASANGAVNVIGTQYVQDDPMSEFDCIWTPDNYPTSCDFPDPVPFVGATAHVFLKNTGGGAVTITDASLAGYSMNYAIRLMTNYRDFSSIYFRYPNESAPQDLLDAGEPIWYKADPNPIPAGKVAQLVLRVREIPTVSTLSIGVITSSSTTMATVTKDSSAPVLASVGFSSDRKKVYLSWRRSGGAAPTTIKMDDTDVTSSATTVGDSSVNYAVTVLTFATALDNMSYHVYQGVYSDGKTATASVRTWVNKFVHALWSSFTLDANYTGEDFIHEATDHGINSAGPQTGDVGGYMDTSGGATEANSHGFGYINQDTGKLNTQGIDPDFFFVNDEPDCEEWLQSPNYCGTGYHLICDRSAVGIKAMTHIATGETMRALRSNTPTSINLNGNYRPESYYVYGQAFDILQTDCYYQKRLTDSYWKLTNKIPVFEKATYIYATSKAAARGAEPNPTSLILFQNTWKCDNISYCDEAYLNSIWPYPDPQTKRIEAYYALAGGAKGLDYWWTKADAWPNKGLDGLSSQAAQDLWKEMGRYGCEIKTLKDQLVTSHPIDMDLAPCTNVWAKALASGTDTIILLAVNDNYYNDIDGCHYTAVGSATVTATLPDWMLSSPSAFEVSAAGISSLSTSLNGSALTVSLGTLNVTKMVVITVDPLLMMTVRQRYDTDIRPGICNFDTTSCNANTSAPSLVRHPAAQAVVSGGTATFSIAADGGGTLTYQWQKNSANQSNGGHYSGCTTPVLTVSTVDTNDVTNYRCKITNTYGSATSNQAALSIVTVNITQHPSAQNVCSGSNGTFSVAATGQGTLYYQWQKDSTNQSNGGHYSGCTTATLTVTGADTNDVASYRCKVTDSTSTAYSNTAALSIKAITSITTHPVNTGVESGGTASLTVAATGYGTLTYQWQKNSSNQSDTGHYSGCTTATLTISTADTNDAANYRCIVTGGCGSATSDQAALTIDTCAPYVDLVNGNFEDWPSGNVAPNWTGAYSATIASQFARMTSPVNGGSYSQKVLSQTTAGAWCHVYQGFATNVGDALTITGYLYPMSAASYMNPQVGVNTSSSRPASWLYTLTSFTKQTWISTGSITCKAAGTNTYVFLETKRNTSSGDTTLYLDDFTVYRSEVPPAPTVTTASTTSLNVNVDPGCNSNNNNAEFAITIGGGSYTLGTHWVQANGTVSTTTVWQTDATWGTKEVTGLTTNTTYTFKTKARYSSTYTQETDQGASAQGTPQSTITITQHPSAQNICSGSNASFSVAATGSGTLTYQWQKTQANISNGGHYSGCTTATLAVTGADTNDVANYRCKVTDANGSLNSNEAALSLKSATAITTHPSAQSTCLGSNASFSVAATGDGTLTYQWQKTQANISNGGHYSGCTTATLAVTGADTNDAYNYRCKVTGGCGSVNSNEAALSLKTATSITTHPSNQSVSSGGTATFTVVGAGDGTLTYQWQKNSSNQSNGGHYSGCTTATLTISTADTNDAANYRCVVTATCGSATSNQASLTITSCVTTSLLNGNFEDWPSGTVAPNFTGAYSATVSSQFVRSTTVHGGSYAQGTKAYTTANSWCHVYQGFGTNVGDALTITGYLYSMSTSAYTNMAIGVNTSSSRPGSWLYTLTSFTKQSWTSVGSITCNASGTTTYVFLETRRAGSSGDSTVYWDDFVVYRAQVPPAPAVAWVSTSSLSVNVDPGCNSTNNNAEYAITISGGGYTEGTHWVQANGTVNTTTVWQTDSTWGNKTVTGLTDNTTYTFKVKARYSSTYTMPTSLGSGAQGTP